MRYTAPTEYRLEDHDYPAGFAVMSHKHTMSSDTSAEMDAPTNDPAPGHASTNSHHQGLIDDILQHRDTFNLKANTQSENESRSSQEETPTDSRQQMADELTDRKNRLIAGMISQFRTLVQLASASPSEGATREMAAAHGLRLEAETQTLVNLTPQHLSTPIAFLLRISFL